jgi:hypothetical protein
VRHTVNTASYPSANCARCNQLSPAIDLVCNNCGHITLIDAASGFRRARFGLIIQTTLVIASILAGVTLFRATGATWPIYLLAVIGIVNVFAVIVSRGAALSVAVGQLVLAALVWVLWEPGMRIFPQFAPMVEKWGTIALVGLLVVGTFCAFAVGRLTALPGMRSTSGWYLGTATFVLGMWGVWGVLVEGGDLPTWAYQVVLGFVLLLPLAILFLILRRERPVGNSRASSSAVWLLLVTVYLTFVEHLTDATVVVFGSFLPGLLDVAPVAVVDFPGWLEFLRWKSLVMTILAIGVVVFVGASSIIDAAAEFRSSKHDYYKQRLADLIARSQRQGGVGSTGATAAQGQILALQVEAMLNVIWDFSSLTTVTFAKNLFAIVQRSVYYLIMLLRYLSPVLAFSILGMLMIATLEDYASYLNSPSAIGSALGRVRLWGEPILVTIVAILLVVLSFGLIRSTGGNKFSSQRQLLAGAESVALILFGVLYLCSLIDVMAFLPLWWALRAAGIDATVIAPGPIQYVNILALVALVVLIVIVRFGIGLGRPRGVKEAYQFRTTALVLAAFGILVVIVGSFPIVSRIVHAAG